MHLAERTQCITFICAQSGALPGLLSLMVYRVRQLPASFRFQAGIDSLDAFAFSA